MARGATGSHRLLHAYKGAYPPALCCLLFPPHVTSVHHRETNVCTASESCPQILNARGVRTPLPNQEQPLPKPPRKPPPAEQPTIK